MDNRYPTSEEIMDKKLIFKKATIKELRLFKKFWRKEKDKDNEIKFKMLETLIKKLGEIYGKPVKITYKPEIPSCCYNQLTKTITMNKSLSIISALHEFSHHIYGPSELQACRWSLQLFRTVFPKAYNKLEWNRHMRVKPKN